MSLLNEAYEFLQQGKLRDASNILHTLLKKEPTESQACYLLGIIAVQNNEDNEARDWFRKTISISPEATPAHYNLGVLSQNKGALPEALDHYQTAADLDPQDQNIRFNLALTCKQLGRLQEAQSHFETILKHTPSDIDSLYNLANTEQQLHNNHAAIHLFETILAQKPDHLAALNNLGYLYHKAGLREKAIPVYQTLIKNNYNSAAAQHLLDSLSGTTTSQAPTAYIKDVFDQFADHFDESLQQDLGYNTPTLLRQLLETCLPMCHFEHGLDLGCGTGLSGETFQNCTETLTGIDLSPKMLEQARLKNIYSALHEYDLVPFIHHATVDYDLYIAADVLVYIGDLNPLFQAIAAKGPEQTLVFSTEQASENYTLKATGRYGHAVRYITKLAKEHGFTILSHQAAPIRKEGDSWIDGELYILHKSATNHINPKTELHHESHRI